MANKKLLYLFTWYITWTIIASLYSNKKGDDVRKEIKSGTESSELEGGKVLFSHLVWIHKKLFNDVSHDENVKKTTNFIASHKEGIQDFFDSSKSEIVNIIKEYSSLWENDVQELATKLQSFVKGKFDSSVQALRQTLSSASEKIQNVETQVKEKISPEKKASPKKAPAKPRKVTKTIK